MPRFTVPVSRGGPFGGPEPLPVALRDGTWLRLSDDRLDEAAHFAARWCAADAARVARARCVALLLARRFPGVAGVRAAVLDLDDETAAVAFAWLGRSLPPQPSPACNVSLLCAPTRVADVPPVSEWWPGAVV